jgi:hypothetical protein
MVPSEREWGRSAQLSSEKRSLNHCRILLILPPPEFWRRTRASDVNDVSYCRSVASSGEVYWAKLTRPCLRD